MRDCNSLSQRTHTPIRTCVGCRSTDAQAHLVRLAKVDGRAVPDVRRRLPGRGAYVHARAECIRGGFRRGGIARGLRCEVRERDVDTILTAVSSRG